MKKLLCGTVLAVAFFLPAVHAQGNNRIVLPFVPALNETAGLSGFVRIVNRTLQSQSVRIEAIDDYGERGNRPIILQVPQRSAIHFNSFDLERGNPGRGILGVGNGTGHWRLVVHAPPRVHALAYARSGVSNTLTELNTTVPEDDSGVDDHVYWVPTVNPPPTRTNVSFLRIVNTGNREALVSVSATDDTGDETMLRCLRISAGHADRVWASLLRDEAPCPHLGGVLRQRTGKTHLRISSFERLMVMNPMVNRQTGFVTNLSALP